MKHEMRSNPYAQAAGLPFPGLREPVRDPGGQSAGPLTPMRKMPCSKIGEMQRRDEDMALLSEAKKVKASQKAGRILIATMLAATALCVSKPALADEAEPFPQGVGSIETPVVQTIDQNGVDLTNGSLHLKSPLLTLGSGDDQFVFGLEWVGRSWQYIGVPTVNRDGDKYFVSFQGQTYEFKNHDNDFEERKPKMGTSLDCGLFQPQDVANFCIFVGRHGEVVHFTTLATPLSPSSPTVGFQTLGLGNLGMTHVRVYDWHIAPPIIGYTPLPEAAHREYGGSANTTPPTGYGFDMAYNSMEKRLGLNGQYITIVTPNLANPDSDDHFLLPDNTIQTITNDFGLQWKYHVNDDQEIEEYEQPGGLAPVFFTYDGDHRVTSVQTADGTWNYTWAGAVGNFRTVTVTAPGGRTLRVTSHKDLGYVKIYEEGPDTATERQTTYTYNTEERMTRVDYPEGNYDTFEYDARGNVKKKQSYPKAGSGDPVLTTVAEYPEICGNRVTCNSPTSILDPELRSITFAYGSTTSFDVQPANGLANQTFQYGDPRPTLIHHTNANTGNPTDGVGEWITYDRGYVQTTSTCITVNVCGNTDTFADADEIYTQNYYEKIPIIATVEYKSGSSFSGFRMIEGSFLQKTGQQVVADGTPRTTCSQIDEKGRVVAAFPPNATGCIFSAVTSQPNNANPPEAAGHTKSNPTYSQ